MAAGHRQGTRRVVLARPLRPAPATDRLGRALNGAGPLVPPTPAAHRAAPGAWATPKRAFSSPEQSGSTSAAARRACSNPQSNRETPWPRSSSRSPTVRRPGPTATVPSRRASRRVAIRPACKSAPPSPKPRRSARNTRRATRNSGGCATANAATRRPVATAGWPPPRPRHRAHGRTDRGRIRGRIRGQSTPRSVRRRCARPRRCRNDATTRRRGDATTRARARRRHKIIRSGHRCVGERRTHRSAHPHRPRRGRNVTLSGSRTNSANGPVKHDPRRLRRGPASVQGSAAIEPTRSQRSATTGSTHGRRSATKGTKRGRPSAASGLSSGPGCAVSARTHGQRSATIVSARSRRSATNGPTRHQSNATNATTRGRHSAASVLQRRREARSRGRAPSGRVPMPNQRNTFPAACACPSA